MDLASFRKKCVLWGVVAFLLSGAFANALATEYWAVWKLDNGGVDDDYWAMHNAKNADDAPRLLRARDRYGLYAAVETRTYSGGGGRETKTRTLPIFHRAWSWSPHLYSRARWACGLALLSSLAAAAAAAVAVARGVELRVAARAAPAVPCLFLEACAVLYSAWRWESHYDDKWKRRLARSTGHDVGESDVHSHTCAWGCGIAAAGAGVLLILAAFLLRLVATATALRRARSPRAAAGPNDVAAAKRLEATKRAADKAATAEREAAAEVDAAAARAADVV